MNKHETRHPYYDVAGTQISGKEFKKRYPARLAVAVSELWGLVFVTEFVGIDHAHRGPPKIFETIVYTKEGALVHSSWAGGYTRARARHLWIGLRAVLGAGLWWHWQAYRGTK